MHAELKKITLNGTTGGFGAARAWIQALNNNQILREKAGFIFKASLQSDHLMLAVEPCLVDGERRYHFNMHLPREDAYTLIGNVDARGVFTLLFHPANPELNDTDRSHYQAAFRALARLLQAGGYAGEGRLDEVTQGLLRKLGISPAPDCLAALARQPPG